MPNRYHPVLAVLVAGGLLAPTPASALLLASASSGGPTVTDSQSAGFAEAASDGPRASGRARAEYGLLRAIGQAAENGPVPPISVNGSGAAAWIDPVTIDAPGLTGQQGTATVHYRIDGTLAINTTARAAANYSFIVELGTQFFHVSRAQYELGGPPSVDFLNQPISATVPLIFGTSRDWHFTIQAVGTVLGVSPTASAITNLGSTATWLGISEVRDAGGNLVSTYSLVSGSGTDWAQPVPVPEPSVFALFGLGTLALFGVSLRRRNGVRRVT